jgi:MFS family permease
LLIVTVGPGYGLAIDAASFGVSAFYLARLRLPVHVNLPPQSFAHDLRDGWREFVARTWVWLIVVAASLGNMMSSVWLVLAATWIKQGHGGAGAWTALLVVSAVGGMVGAVAALRAKPRRPLLVASLVIVPNALPLVLLALKLPWETYLVAALITGFGNMLFNTLWETTLQQHIPAAALSRVSAYDWFGSLLCQPLGLALAGIVAEGIGFSETLWIAAGVDCVAVAAMLVAPSVRNLRRLDEPAFEQVPQQLVAD